MTLPLLAYAYTHNRTESTTGYFSCEPPASLSFEDALKRLEEAPMDEFLHRHVLTVLASRSLEELQLLCLRAMEGEGACARPVLGALILECAVIHAAFAPLEEWFPEGLCAELAAFTPLPVLRWHLLPDKDLHSRWAVLFQKNICEHTMLPHPDDIDLPLLYAREDVQIPSSQLKGIEALFDCHVARMRQEGRHDRIGKAWERPPARETALQALDGLLEADILDGQEMRHEASLSPIALLRPWRVAIAVANEGLNYTLQGKATTYGRGLSVEAARVSYAMEMVERASSYMSVASCDAATLSDIQEQSAFCDAAVSRHLEPFLAGSVVGLSHPLALYRARFSEIKTLEIAAFDPNSLPLEVAYTDAPLHWVWGQSANGGEGVLVPLQIVGLFCNLDESALFMAGGSTGLASGNTLAEAKVAALVEIIERDAEATMPFHPSRCFSLKSREPRLQGLLDDYAARGIQVQFQDITTELGVPCYQCFVMGRKGEIIRATGAGLDGTRAALAALTETPYPYPHGEASGPRLRHLPEYVLEDLPNYSLGSAEDDLALLEALFIEHGHCPVYVTLTRKDLGLPVVRAVVPDMELTAEWDAFSRVRPRLFQRWLAMTPQN